VILRTTRWRVLFAFGAASTSIVLMCLPGCAHVLKTDRMLESPAPSRDRADRAAAAYEATSAFGHVQLVSAKAEQSSVPLDRRIVIYSAGYRIVVKDVETAMTSMEQITESTGGYVQLIDGDRITVRVPVARYQETMERVEVLGKVVHRKMEATDVTEEYVDLEARLKNARAVRGRLEALLEMAEDVIGALEVEKELKRLGEEIERLEAKLELIKNRVALSSISVTFERVARSATGLIRTAELPFEWLRQLDPQRLLRTY